MPLGMTPPGVAPPAAAPNMPIAAPGGFGSLGGGLMGGVRPAAAPAAGSAMVGGLLRQIAPMPPAGSSNYAPGMNHGLNVMPHVDNTRER